MSNERQPPMSPEHMQLAPAPQHAHSTGASDKRPDGPPAAPRWVKILGLVVLILVLLAIIVMVTGIGGVHGPGRHLPSGAAGNAAFTTVTAAHALTSVLPAVAAWYH